MEYVVRVSGSTKIQPKVINIDGSDDSFYRYKMRQLYVQVVGKGKMIKTNLLNIDDVSHDLRIPPSFFTAYIGYELGTPSKFDAKKPERERGSISGDYEPSILSGIVKKMISEWILCPNCKYPECTTSVEPKTKKIQIECRSCGGISFPTLNDKFTKFILNNESRLQEIKQQMTKVTPKAVAKKSSGKKPKGEAKNSEGFEDEDDDDDWAAPPVRDQHEQEALNQLAQVSITCDLDSISKSLAAFSSSHSKEEIVAEVNRLQKENKLDNSAALELLFPYLITSGEVSALKENAVLFKSFLSEQEAQISFINCIEQHVTTESNASQVSLALKQFYDEELLDEESILVWHSRDFKAQVGAILRERAKPFIDWLQTAEEEDDEDE
eukprot:TRINITY_DN3312_c0_g1_i1.p1 TRINITY_DN3312_c0_g1~~TRINITY_DN3312_c0_g1_i1.p1  ORF type:complete len:382 (-),score=66.04 TRINITY_DN3312_c0_g1_i1:48-1193(-)